MNNDDVTHCILNIFPVNSQVNAYEAYTEFWAEFIHILFLVKNRNEITKRIHREREWSLIQANKILSYYNIH
mgnify:CR=1 FL=1